MTDAILTAVLDASRVRVRAYRNGKLVLDAPQNKAGSAAPRSGPAERTDKCHGAARNARD
jgi:hypothetical protein